LKKTKPQNLLERLDHHQKSVLAFLGDFCIPFTNNRVPSAIVYNHDFLTRDVRKGAGWLQILASAAAVVW
jgi:hypothetical protein